MRNQAASNNPDSLPLQLSASDGSPTGSAGPSAGTDSVETSSERGAIRKIVVATDFSGPASNAVDFAVGLAGHFEADVVLVKAHHLTQRADMFKNVEDIMQRDDEDALRSEAKAIQAKLTGRSRVDTRTLRGHESDVIPSFAKREEADLVVLGTHGASGLEQIFLGSTAASVMRTCDVPVLAVPMGRRYAPFHRMALALESCELPERKLTRAFRQLAKGYAAETVAFHVQQGDEVASPDVTLVESEKGSSVAETIDDFVKEIDADLLCMMRSHRGFLSHLLGQSTIRKEVFRTEVPLLVLPG